MKKALEGLKGVAKVEMDLAHDLFRVTLSEGGGPSEEALFKAVQELNYTPSLAPQELFQAAPPPVHLTGNRPEIVERALAKAKTESKKFVLVDCMGDN